MESPAPNLACAIMVTFRIDAWVPLSVSMRTTLSPRSQQNEMSPLSNILLADDPLVAKLKEKLSSTMIIPMHSTYSFICVPSLSKNMR